MRLTIIQDNCEMLHGGIKDEDRMAAVDRFQTDPSVFVELEIALTAVKLRPTPPASVPAEKTPCKFGRIDDQRVLTDL
jgi:hypothetical protein